MLRRQQLAERCEHPGLEPAELRKCVDELQRGALIETKTQALRIAEQKGQRLGQILFPG